MTRGEVPPDVQIVSIIEDNLDFVHSFARTQADLVEHFAQLKASIKVDGMVWIAWIKKFAKIPTDLTEDIIRNIGLVRRLVDVKVCAINATWSGLKFVYRNEDRK